MAAPAEVFTGNFLLALADVMPIMGITAVNRVSRVAGMCQESKGDNTVTGQVQFNFFSSLSSFLPVKNILFGLGAFLDHYV